MTRNANSFNSFTSATGLQLLIEQDEVRLNVSYEQIKSAIKELAGQVLCLYRQFSPQLRVMRGDEGGMFAFCAQDICDDVVLEADSELNLTPARRRAAVYELLSSGLLADDKGNIPQSVKNKLLARLGYSGMSGRADLEELHRARCEEENAALADGYVAAKPYDDHDLHIQLHTAYLLGNQLSAQTEEAFLRHLAEHKNYLKEESNG